jgi:hypothetical protein
VNIIYTRDIHEAWESDPPYYNWRALAQITVSSDSNDIPRFQLEVVKRKEKVIRVTLNPI